ncbi:unnamed protein product, partial [Urochloa humidicola]
VAQVRRTPLHHEALHRSEQKHHARGFLGWGPRDGVELGQFQLLLRQHRRPRARSGPSHLPTATALCGDPGSGGHAHDVYGGGQAQLVDDHTAATMASGWFAARGGGGCDVATGISVRAVM